MEYSVTVSQLADKLKLSYESVRGIISRNKIPYIIIDRDEYKKQFGDESLKGNKPYLYHTTKSEALVKDILERRQISSNSGPKKLDPSKDIKSNRHLYYDMAELKAIFGRSQTYINVYIGKTNAKVFKPVNDAKKYYLKEEIHGKVIDAMIMYSQQRSYTVKLHEIKKRLNG